MCIALTGPWPMLTDSAALVEILYGNSVYVQLTDLAHFSTNSLRKFKVHRANRFSKL